MRNLLIFILVIVVIWWVRRALSKPRGGDARSAGGRRAGAKDAPEPMLACDQCGVHVPQSEGVRDGAGFFCCEEHRRLGARR